MTHFYNSDKRGDFTSDSQNKRTVLGKVGEGSSLYKPPFVRGSQDPEGVRKGWLSVTQDWSPRAEGEPSLADIGSQQAGQDRGPL